MSKLRGWCAVQDFVADGSHDDREIDSDEMSQDGDDDDDDGVDPSDNSDALLYSSSDEPLAHGGAGGDDGGGSTAFGANLSSFEPSASPDDDDHPDGNST